MEQSINTSNQPSKLYYTIGEVSRMFKVNTSLIRFWEKEFDVLQPKKNAKGNRKFTPADVKNLEFIYYLVKERGFTLDGAKKRLKENKGGKTDNLSIIRHLKEIRGFLVDLKEEL